MSIALTADFVAQLSFTVLKSYLPTSSVEELQWEWSQKTLKKFKISLEVKGQISHQKPMIFVGNHISYLDIVLLMATVPSVSFVAKKELAMWPIVGHAARKTNTIFVKREKNESRKNARAAITQGLAQQQRIAVFPSGTTGVSESKQWRRGIFEVAQQANAMILPFRLSYEPMREVAYIDDDFFPLHLFRLTQLKQIKAKIEFHEPVKVLDPEKDCETWRQWSQDPKFHKSNHE